MGLPNLKPWFELTWILKIGGASTGEATTAYIHKGYDLKVRFIRRLAECMTASMDSSGKPTLPSTRKLNPQANLIIKGGEMGSGGF